MFHCPPQVVGLAVDLHEDLVQVPTPLGNSARSQSAPTSDLRGKHWTKPAPPEAHGLMADVDPSLKEKILDLSSATGGKRMYIITVSRITSGDELK